MNTDKKYLELEKNKFLHAYNQEAKRNNELMEKYPGKGAFEKTDQNLNTMLEFFEFACQYINTIHTHNALLKVENHLLQQDYMKEFSNEIDKALNTKLNG